MTSVVAILFGRRVFFSKGLDIHRPFRSFIQKHANETAKVLWFYALVGAILGLFYFIGGQTIEFSSWFWTYYSKNHVTYGAWALVD